MFVFLLLWLVLLLPLVLILILLALVRVLASNEKLMSDADDRVDPPAEAKPELLDLNDGIRL